jgi:hypothetical protein
MDSSSSSSLPSDRRRISKEEAERLCQLRFPFQLHDMLQDASTKGFESIISWQPCGTAFKVHNQDLFQQAILPTYFGMKKYKSFQRQLHWYTFDKATNGYNNGE